MNIIFRALAMMPLVLPVANVNAADQVKPVAVERGATAVKSEPPLQGGSRFREVPRYSGHSPPKKRKNWGAKVLNEK